MRIQTFSVVIGTRACDAHCRFCISHMTGFSQLPSRREIDLCNFGKAVRLAASSGCNTLLFTGKGEPTLYPDEIEAYLDRLHEMGDPFPLLELQTNAIRIGRELEGGGRGEPLLPRFERWRAAGLDTIAISTVGQWAEHNRENYLWHRAGEPYPDLELTVGALRRMGFSVRVGVMMMRSVYGEPAKVLETIDWAREAGVTQLTLRPIRRPGTTADSDTARFVESHGVNDEFVRGLRALMVARGTKLLTLLHGAEVFDVGGQNVCLTDCLTIRPETEDIRTLIYYSTGEVSYDWQFPGAKILDGKLIAELD